MQNGKQNLLNHLAVEKIVEHGSRGQYFRWVALGLGVVLFVLVLMAVSIVPYRGALEDGYKAALSGQSHLNTAKGLLEVKKLKEATQELKMAENSFGDSYDSLEIAKSAVALRFGYLRGQLNIAEKLALIGRDVSASLGEVTNLGAGILALTEKEHVSFLDLKPTTKASILGQVFAARESLEQVDSILSGAGTQLAEIKAAYPLYFFKPAIDALDQTLPALESGAGGLSAAVKLAPLFAGYPEQRNYLLLMENNRELRPGGGFIGTYGLLSLKNASIETFFTDDIYNLDKLSIGTLKVEPPAPIKKYLNQEFWYMRDSNWWPDFPASAVSAQKFFKQETAILATNNGLATNPRMNANNLNGVIAITPTVMEELLGVTGEITVGGVSFNKENFWAELEYEVEQAYYGKDIPKESRKDIVGAFGQVMIAKLSSLPLKEWPELFAALSRLTEEKQIMVYMNKPVDQQVITDLGLAGEIKSAPMDYILVADSNMAALKTDEVMKRTLNYSLNENDAGELIVAAIMNYENLGEGHTWKNTRYKNYSRIYVPLGSELQKVRVGREEIPLEQVDRYTEFGKMVWGAYIVIEPRQSQELAWTYKLPANIAKIIKDQGKYELLVQKQPGLPELGLNLNVSLGWRNLHEEKVMKADQLFQLTAK